MGKLYSVKSFLPNVPIDIVNAIESEFQALDSRFSRHDWGPAELNGARFAETIFRYLEWKQSGGAYTPIGTQLNRQNIVNRVFNDANVIESLRFHVLRSSELLLDIRNKRNVAHLGTTVDVDEMDSRLVIRVAKWILSEIIRVESSRDPKEIQEIVDSLSVKELPLIEVIDGEVVIVATHLKTDDRVLVSLYHSYPDPIEINALRELVRYKNSTRFRDEILNELYNDGIIYMKSENVFLTGKGCAWVEKHVDMHLEI